MEQLLIHLWGDYLTQSDWMAQNKTRWWFPALCHAVMYSLGFLLLRPSSKALAVILVTHYFIDRYRLARYVVWAKNWLAPSRNWSEWETGDGMPHLYQENRPMLPFRFCAKTGYPPQAPEWLAVWLMIIADNILHLTINYFSLKYL